MKVLLIEPDKSAAKLYHDTLKAEGMFVALEKTAQDALYRLDDFNPDCIVLELDIKIHNGFEFIYEFCSQHDWKHIPIILHTQISPDRTRNMLVNWKDLNVTRYLYKPETSLHELKINIREVIAEAVT